MARAAAMGDWMIVEEEKFLHSCYSGSHEAPVRWVNDYCSLHDVLLVGEGDFSFSLSLAVAFGSAANIVATSLDLEDDLVQKYSQARLNVYILRRLGAMVLHGVDATKMMFHPDLQIRKFDRIIFNFPHAGFRMKEDNLLMIKIHRNLVREFFSNASRMLRLGGEIHVNHKTTAPFCNWKIEELAASCMLRLVGCVVFNQKDYLGYNNKRGSGGRCDQPFPIGESSTYKFMIKDTGFPIHVQLNKMEFDTRKTQQVCHVPFPLGENSSSEIATIDLYRENVLSNRMCFPSYKAPILPTIFRQKSTPYKYYSQNRSFPPAPEIFASVDNQFVRPDYMIREKRHSELAQHPKFHYLGGSTHCPEMFLRREYELCHNVEARLGSFFERKEEEKARFFHPRLF